MIAAELEEEVRQRPAPRPDLEDLQATLVQRRELGDQIGEDRVLEACAIAIGNPMRSFVVRLGSAARRRKSSYPKSRNR